MSDVNLSGDAVDALNKILTHAATVGGVIGINSMGPDDWSAVYNFGEETPGSSMAAGSAVAMDKELDEVIIGVAKQAGLV